MGPVRFLCICFGSSGDLALTGTGTGSGSLWSWPKPHTHSESPVDTSPGCSLSFLQTVFSALMQLYQPPSFQIVSMTVAWESRSCSSPVPFLRQKKAQKPQPTRRPISQTNTAHGPRQGCARAQEQRPGAAARAQEQGVRGTNNIIGCERASAGKWISRKVFMCRYFALHH